MAKVQLGKTPKSFSKQIEVVTLEGNVAHIDVKYVYRTRTQFAELCDNRPEPAGEGEGAEKEGAKFSVVDWFAQVDNAGADFVLQIADGWDLDDPFNKETLLQLEDEFPGALLAITTKYRQSVAEARVKN